MAITASLASFDVAERFVTGGGSNGYALHAITIDFSSAPPGLTVKVGTGSAHSLTSPVTLTNPSSLAVGNNRFTAPAGTVLSASTTYSVVIEGSGGAIQLTNVLTENGAHRLRCGGGAGRLAATASSANRLRFVLEGSRPFAFGAGRVPTPTLEIGGALVYADANLGLTVEARGRTLVAHGDCRVASSGSRS